MAIADADFAGPARRMLERGFSDSTPAKAEELGKRGFRFRFAVRCAPLMAPFQ